MGQPGPMDRLPSCPPSRTKSGARLGKRRNRSFGGQGNVGCACLFGVGAPFQVGFSGKPTGTPVLTSFALFWKDALALAS